MKKTFFLSSVIFAIMAFHSTVYTQTVEGIWKTIDDKDGEATSHIEIVVIENELKGKVVKLLQDPEDVLCELCKGEKHMTPVVGLEVIHGMTKKGDQWRGGKILDPENGKEYKCKIELEDKDVLKVRGFIGLSVIGRTQRWYRVQP